MPRHECWDLFVPKDRPAQTQAQGEKLVQWKDWFGSLVKSHPHPASAPRGGEPKPH